MNQDPTLDERRYFRHFRTGERAYVVIRDGIEKLHLDRPQDIVVPKTDDWHEDDSIAIFTLQQVARVAYSADRRLLAALGYYQEAEDDWTNLPEKTRIDWVKYGPMVSEKDPKRLLLRDQLYNAIMDLLRPLAK